MNLFSERLRYRKLTAEDFPVYLDMATNAEVMKYITGKILTIKEAAERLYIMTEANKGNPHTGFYMVYEKDNDHFIGLGKLVFINDDAAEIGYSLLPQYWGKRYASEIAGFFITHARTITPVKNLVALVNPENTASKKLLGKNGFAWVETGFLNEQVTEIYKLCLTEA